MEPSNELAEGLRLANEAEIRVFVEAMAEGVLLTAADGTILMVNSRLEQMFGYSRAEILGNRLDMLVPERYRSAHQVHRKSYFAEPRVRAMGAGRDLAGRRKDGTEFPVEIGLSFVNTGQGTLALGLVTDITERKRIDAELSRINAELARSNTELGQFAYVASHDLQEPLRMITGYLQLLEKRYSPKLDDDAREFIRFAVDGAVRMKRLIEDLLALSRAGTQAVHLEPVAAQTLLEAACSNLEVRIKESQAEVTADELPVICVDPGLMTQVFQNLIGNAIKFQQPDHQPRAHISAKQTAEGWVFAVRDDGIGIPAEHQERVFGIFERLHGADQYGGSGMGLAITRRILERHGGRVWVESKAGKGSTFFLLLPAPAAAVDTSRAATGKS